MEKRALLAVTLSLAILYAWSIVFPAPKPKPRVLSPAVEAAAPGLKPETPVSPTTIAPSSSVAAVTEELHTLEMSGTKLIFSSIGGTLKQVEFPDYKDRFPVTRLILLAQYQDAPFVLESATDAQVKYSLNTPEAKIEKTYTIKDGLIHASVFVQSKMSRMDKYDIVALDINTSNISPAVLAGSERSLFEYGIFAADGVHRKGNAVHFEAKEGRQAQTVVDLISYRDHYYCVVVHPEFSTLGYQAVFPSKNTGEFNLSAPAKSDNSDVYEFIIYAGQQDIAALKSYGKGLDRVVSFSNFGLFDAMAKFLYNVFVFTHKIIPNWGVCIIIIGLLIYFSVYPLTMRGMASMRRMQSLQPEMSALREKYKNNPQKMNKEVMELYKNNKINPLSGCLTFILQMPIFIAIYQVLWRSPFFRGADFLWIKDLSQPDQLFLLPQSLPFIGNQFNILPIVMAVIMFFQQKITMSATPVSDPAQAAQQRMMLIFFPIFLGFIFYKFASALVLYFTVFYALSALTQLKMSKLSVK